MNYPYDAIYFDFDGVLADSERLHWECWIEILEPFGIDLPWSVYCANCIGVSDRRMISFLASQSAEPIDSESLWREYPAKKLKFRKKSLENPPMLARTVELVRSLTGYRLAVVTSSGRAEVEPVLHAAGVWGCFHAAVFGEDVANHKPAPDPYLRAGDLAPGRRALVVEDSDAGVASGQAAGLDVLRVLSASEVPDAVRERLRSAR